MILQKAKVLSLAASLVIEATKTTFVDSLVCVTLKGSAVKGDFIQDYSDFDFHVFIKSKAMDGEKCPKVEYAVKFQKAIGNVNSKEFGASQFQIYFINSKKYPRNWVTPVDGTYKILLGNMPPALKERNDLEYLHSAKQLLSNVNDDQQKLVERFVDKPNTAITALVRLLGVTIKAHMCSVAILATSKPKIVLRTKLHQLIPLVEEEIKSDGHLDAFWKYISNWSKVQQNPDYARKAFKEGIKALDEINRWNHS